MEYHDILGKLAPCGLDCSRCVEHEAGEVTAAAAKLLQSVKGYQRLAVLKAQKYPEYQHYEQFEAVLKLLSQGSCGGCRGDNCTCPINCVIKDCHKQQKVDFCFQCAKFPCEKPIFVQLKDRWLTNNNRMKEIGPVNYYSEQLNKPRYS